MIVARSQLSYYPEPELEIQEEERPYKKRRKKRNNSSLKLFYIFTAIMVLGTCLFILSRYAAITSVRTDITNLEKEKMELEKTKMDLIAELEGIKSSEGVAQDAILKLGMDYPTEDQIVYISVKDSSIEEVEKVTIQNQVKKAFSVVASLF